jgi:uncharacterized protein (TIGR02246 family)
MKKYLILFTLVASLSSCDRSAPVAASPGPDPALEALKAQVATLEAREQIRELFTSYGRTLDSRDFTAFGQLFAAESEYVGGGDLGVSRGPEAIGAALENVITTNATGANLHVYSNEQITITGPDTAVAQSRGAFYVQNETGGPMALIFATYNDEFVREGGEWKFKRREVIGDIPGPSNEERAAARRNSSPQ